MPKQPAALGSGRKGRSVGELFDEWRFGVSALHQLISEPKAVQYGRGVLLHPSIGQGYCGTDSLLVVIGLDTDGLHPHARCKQCLLHALVQIGQQFRFFPLRRTWRESGRPIKVQLRLCQGQIIACFDNHN
jgi:hypothetical protein